MIKHILLLAFTALLSLTAQAQFRYIFKDTTAPYTPLTGAASLNGSVVWDEDDFSAPMPFTWKMDSTISVNSLELAATFPAVLAGVTNPADLNGFLLGDVDLADRGVLANTSSLSPISYTTAGTAPNRIFKVEFANAGFYKEYDLYNTMADSVSFQVWVYETKNIVELHFGPSRITHPGDYWGYTFGATGPLFAYGKHVDFDMLSTGSFYHLKGNPAAPGVDTFHIPPGSTSPIGLSAWPANGKVYRFTPKVGCVLPISSFASSIPAGKSVGYMYDGTTIAIDSIVWDFGDGQKQKMTTGYSTPILHTFAAYNRYNVCVAAYNKCGSHNFCKQMILAVGNLSALGDVKVYPNPANDQLTVEGMQAGDKVSMRSIVGQQVIYSTISSSRHVLDLSRLSAGTYMLLLSDRNGASGSVSITKQ